jgi:hypothetical protein
MSTSIFITKINENIITINKDLINLIDLKFIIKYSAIPNVKTIKSVALFIIVMIMKTIIIKNLFLTSSNVRIEYKKNGAKITAKCEGSAKKIIALAFTLKKGDSQKKENSNINKKLNRIKCNTEFNF